MELEQPVVETPVEETQVTTETIVENTSEPVVETVQESQPVIEVPEELTADKVGQKFSDPTQKQALLKALGYDDFALGALDYYQRTGSLAEYAEVKSVDYNKLPDEKIVERKLREQYANAGLTEDELHLLIQDEMTNRFKLDADQFSEMEVRVSKAKLKAEASEFRKTLIDRQQQFKAPEREVHTEPTYEQQVEQARTQVLMDQGVKQFLEAKKLTMGDAQNPYNFEIQNPQDTLAILYDTNKYHDHVTKKNEQGQVIMHEGKPVMDYQKMLKIAAYVQNMEQIEKNLINHGRTLGKIEVTDEAENVGLNKENGVTTQADTLENALLRRLQQR